ncbi:MAG: D-alanyl-D-alanine carboxypeptidase/D-alanyl-D-alanine endopeptidase [Acidimicrobiales bacterium]
MRNRKQHRAPAGFALVALIAVVAPGVPAATAADPPTSVPVTPVLSLRRVPGFVTGIIGDRRLASTLGPVMNDTGGPPGQACLSVRDPDGRTVFSQNPTVALIPASTMKLETATAVLARLGGDSHLTTEVRAGAPPVGGAVSGDLWLVGGGDPLLATADFALVAGYNNSPRLSTSMETLADRVVAAGVRRIEGGVVGDESRYDTQRYVPTWNPTYAALGEIGPQSALTVNGGFVEWRPRTVPAPAPATKGAAVLTALLKARGVTVGREASEGRAQPGAVITSIDSPSMADMVGVMLQESDNLAAESLVKEMGVRFGSGGTTTAGLAVVKETLASLKLPVDGLTSADGSGLDRSDRLTCDSLQSTLARSGENGDLGRNMPVAGRNGTLARRFASTPAEGRVRAKTGSLQGVTALSGWTTSLDGRPLQFSLLANELPRDSAGTGLQDRVVSALATWPQAPPPADISPLPPQPRPG